MGFAFHIRRGQIARGRVLGVGDVLVEGRLDGEVDLDGCLRVAEGAVVEGPVRARSVEVHGEVLGAVTAREGVSVAGGALVWGDIRASRLSVDDAARVSGTLRFEADEASPPSHETEGVRLEGELDGHGGADPAGSVPAPAEPRGRIRARWRGGPLIALALCVLATGASGCASRPLTLSPAPRSFTADDYEDVYEAWTRDKKAFSMGELSDVLNVSATFESWEFRWAYVVRYAHDHSLDAEARDAMLRATLADAEEHHRFFVTLSSRKFKESDLTSERSAWRVLLVDEAGRKTVPVEIEKIRRPGAVERVYFPSINPFRQVFRVVFPAQRPDGSPTIPSGADAVILRFTGALGQVDLRWDLQSGRGSPRGP